MLIIGTQDTAKISEHISKINENKHIDYFIVDYSEFANKETYIKLPPELIKNQDVLIISDPNAYNNEDQEISLNDRLFQTFMIIQTAKKFQANSVNVFFTCFPYSRQDNSSNKKWEPDSLQILISFLETLGVSNVITFDIHNIYTKLAFKDTNFVNIEALDFLQKAYQKMDLQNPLLVPTDEWWTKKIKSFAESLELPNIVVDKSRDYSKPNSVNKINVYNDISWKDLIIYDDILDTWWSLCQLIQELNKQKPASVNIAVSHWMFNWTAFEKLNKEYQNWNFQKIYTTNSIKRENLPKYIETVNIDDIINHKIQQLFFNNKKC